MNKSVLEVLEQALTGSSEIVVPKLPVTRFDRALGKLRSHTVPKLMGVVWHFGSDSIKMNKSADIGIGVEAVLNLIKSELIVEYGHMLEPEEEVAVRWDSVDGLIVVAVSCEILRDFMASPRSN